MGCEAIPESWRPALEPVLVSPEARRLGGWLRAEEDAGRTIYPPRGQRLRALDLTPLDAVKVVILGQDPYHGPGQAMGLSFSVPHGAPPPPSLANIYKELATDCGISRPTHGDLTTWARQGVLLLNATPDRRGGARRAAMPGAAGRRSPMPAWRRWRSAPSLTVFILWGSHARKKASRVPALARNSHHLIVASAHPSPLSAHNGFFGSRPFSQTNAFLEANGRGAIDWRL
jgi:uracil-DNA glycosylase